MQARAAYKLALEGGNTEAEIYDHLYRFFERYYDNGDFLSKRYYARENDSRAAPICPKTQSRAASEGNRKSESETMLMARPHDLSV